MAMKIMMLICVALIIIIVVVALPLIKSKKELNYYIQQKNILIENITNKDNNFDYEEQIKELKKQNDLSKAFKTTLHTHGKYPSFFYQFTQSTKASYISTLSCSCKRNIKQALLTCSKLFK